MSADVKVHVHFIRRGFAGVVAVIDNHAPGLYDHRWTALAVGTAKRELGSPTWRVLLYPEPGKPEGAEEMTARTLEALDSALKDRLRNRGPWWS